MENSSINFESSKDIIKKNMISRVDSIIDITSEDKIYKYLNRDDADSEEKKLILNKKEEDKKNLKNNLSISFCIFLISFLISFFSFLYPVSNGIYEITMSIFASITFSYFLGMIFLIIKINKYGSIRGNSLYASSIELRELYIKVFKDNINDYLPLNSEELKHLYNSNEFIKAYVDKNPDEIFTRYSLNNVAGIKMNNLHMINEFKDIIDNKKMLIGLPEGQKIVVHNSIKKEQKL